MAYDLNKKLDKAIKLLKDNPTILTDLQVYGRIGVSHQYWHEIMLKHEKAETIRDIMDDNKSRISRTATDKLIQLSRDSKPEVEYKATATLARIADKQLNKVLAPNRQMENEEEKEIQDVDSLKASIRQLIDKNGFHE